MPKLTESSAVRVPEEKKKKSISSMDFFGCSPVQRKEGRHLTEKVIFICPNLLVFGFEIAILGYILYINIVLHCKCDPIRKHLADTNDLFLIRPQQTP